MPVPDPMPAPAVLGERRPRIAWYWWPIWMALLALGLLVFYGVFTPGWMAVRAVAWLSERRPRRRPAAQA